MQCLIIDDEPLALDVLKDYVAKISFLECVGAFRDPIKAAEYLQQNRVDLIFLDINMPDLTGIQFLKSLTRPPLVIFTTAYSEYALESYDYDAVDYLLKPIEFERFVKAVNKALEKLQNKANGLTLSPDEKYVLIKSGTKYHKLKLKDILYIQGTGNYVTFVTPDKEILSLLTMQAVLDMLPAEMFFRIHRSYIVNFLHVDLIEGEEVKIQDRKLPIGDLYREDFLRAVKGK